MLLWPGFWTWKSGFLLGKIKLWKYKLPKFLSSNILWLGGGIGDYCSMLIVSASGDGRVLEMDGGDGYVALWMCLIPLNCKVGLCIFYHNKNNSVMIRRTIHKPYVCLVLMWTHHPAPQSHYTRYSFFLAFIVTWNHKDMCDYLSNAFPHWAIGKRPNLFCSPWYPQCPAQFSWDLVGIAQIFAGWMGLLLVLYIC